MKDTRFIELVNLYIDRQLSPAEAAEFEHEIQTNPQRRHTYRQYCRMHRATTLVYESFRAHAEQQGESAGAGRPATIARLEHRQRRRSRWTYAAGLAAAACVAFVLVRNAPPPEDTARPPMPVPASRAATMAAVTPLSAPVDGAVSLDARQSLAGLRQNLLAESDYTALLTATRLQEQRLLDLLPPPAGSRLSLFDDGLFEDRGAFRAPASAPGRRPRPPAEFTAFQFQR